MAIHVSSISTSQLVDLFTHNMIVFFLQTFDICPWRRAEHAGVLPAELGRTLVTHPEGYIRSIS